MHSALPDCESMGEGEPERDWKVAPFSDGIVVFISKLGEGPRPNTRLPPPGGPPFKDPLVRSAIQYKHYKHIHIHKLLAYYSDQYCISSNVHILCFQITD